MASRSPAARPGSASGSPLRASPGPSARDDAAGDPAGAAGTGGAKNENEGDAVADMEGAAGAPAGKPAAGVEPAGVVAGAGAWPRVADQLATVELRTAQENAVSLSKKKGEGGHRCGICGHARGGGTHPSQKVVAGPGGGKAVVVHYCPWHSSRLSRVKFGALSYTAAVQYQKPHCGRCHLRQGEEGSCQILFEEVKKPEPKHWFPFSAFVLRRVSEPTRAPRREI